MQETAQVAAKKLSDIELEKKMLHDIAQTIGLKVCDVWGDCMFESIAKQLDKLNKFNKVYTQTHHATVRQQCTAWLRQVGSQFFYYGTPISSFLMGNECWEAYLDRMVLPGKYGDHLILIAAIHVYGITIKVVPANSADVILELIPPNLSKGSDKLIHLGFYPVWEHYCGLDTENPVTVTPMINEANGLQLQYANSSDVTTLSTPVVAACGVVPRQHRIQAPMCARSYLLQLKEIPQPSSIKSRR